ncbi:hypothetical protein ACH5RR_006860 [Cinchona calisaya]|uniref:Uncharacterized protein n=1 Tax=Cinchona calisaya TaxID=153742 RepID=A0ABD3AQ48_9GENT
MSFWIMQLRLSKIREERGMGFEMLEMVLKLRKIMMFTTRRCYTSVCSHPFLVGMLCFLVYVYRSSPFVFSLLVSASPVLACSAVLLGTLLSFGQPNIPEIEKDEKTTHEIVSLKTEVSGDATVVDKNESYSVEKFSDERGDLVEQLNIVASSFANRTGELHKGHIVDSVASLIVEGSRKMEFENRVVEELGRKMHNEGYEQKDEINEERLVDGKAKTDDEDLELENDNSPAESFDSERVNVDSLDSPPSSPWKHVEEGENQEEEEEEDDEDIDSGSDRAESSSPDASMADIFPLLDELHPLLDEDAPQPVSVSHDGSNAASERSLKSCDSSSESDDNNEKHEDTDVADEDNEDADDDDEAQGNREGQTQSGITWTEEDQKNLMDLGTSELERNQRLESLISRRRARKTMTMMPERNLIDLDSADLPFNIAPISTARNNPFDLSHDSYDNMGLPPIPGSAPSILLLRRNPFDLPYDSSEEKPNLMGDSFQQEFTAVKPKEPFFRRHESFNVGPSLFGPGRQDRQDGRLRPFFVAERNYSDGASYSSFQRQSSGLSDSKTSSVSETESVASAGDIDDMNLFEENMSHQAEPLSSVLEMEMRDSAEDLDNKSLSKEDISHESDFISMKEDKSTSEEDISLEQVLISKIEHVSEHVGHGSQSSEETDSLELGEVEKRDVEANEVEIDLWQLEHHHEGEPVSLKEGSVSNLMGFNATEIPLNAEALKQGYRSTSSSSSLPEVSERIFSEREAGLSNIVERSDHTAEEGGIPAQPSQEGSDLNMRNDTRQKEPVYDSSPPAVRKNLSLSSMPSDLHVEADMPLIVIKRTVSFVETESESDRQDMANNTPDDNDISASMLIPIDENQCESRITTDISHIMQFDLSGDDNVIYHTSAPAVPEPIVNHALRDSKSSQETAVEEDLMYRHGNEYRADQSFCSVNAGVHLVIHNVVPPSVEFVASFEDSIVKEVAFQPKRGQDPSLTSLTDLGHGVCIGPEEKQISAHDQSTSQEKPIAEYVEGLVFLDESIDETSSRDNHEPQETAVIPEEIIEEVSFVDNVDVQGALELEQEVSLNINTLMNLESISMLSEAYESRAAEVYSDVESNIFHDFGNNDGLQASGDKLSAEASNSEVNEKIIDNDADAIKEIDEVLLLELDVVGDFSIRELHSTTNL